MVDNTFIAVPVGILGTVLGWLVLPRTDHDAAAQAELFDRVGVSLLGPAIASLLLD